MIGIQSAALLLICCLLSSCALIPKPGLSRDKLAASSGAIIVDHNAVRDFDRIPPRWIEAARRLTLHYAHTSHGTQLMYGALALEASAPAFSIAIKVSPEEGLPPKEDPPALRIYDGDGRTQDSYVSPRKYWKEDAGVNATRAIAKTGRYNFSLWSWCGEQSYNDKSTVQQYLTTLTALEAEFPRMRFIYMTGHTDGGGWTLHRNNELVRDYVAAHGKVLFDFADIESYDPDGRHYPYTKDGCAWCATWCDEHPEDCKDLTTTCAHSHPYNCKLKAKAFWYMMARLAGWDGK